MIHRNKQNRKAAPMFNAWGKTLHISYLIKKNTCYSVSDVQALEHVGLVSGYCHT